MDNKDQLQKLRDKMLDLQTGNLDVEAENPKIVRCWERLGCGKTDCPAYGKLRCWAIAGTLCHNDVKGEHALELGDCKKCIVYQESCGDEVAELLEVFNQTVKELKYNFKKEEKRIEKFERLTNLEQMAATVAHETRNPLQAISTALAYLKKNHGGDIVTDFLSVIDTEVRRLTAVIDSFMKFAQPVQPNLESCDLNELIFSLLKLFKQDAADKELHIHFQPEPTLTSCPCDPVYLRQALAQLLDNAIDASPQGGSIILACGAQDGAVRLSVKDHGPGMAAAEIDNALKPFYTSKTRGAGLGLAMVDKIVGAHGGEIKVASEPGRGTEVEITLPVRAGTI